MSRLRKLLARLGREDKGMTLIELLLTAMISAAIAGAIAATIMQTNDTVILSRNRLTATNWARTAQNWIQTDVKMAQNVELGSNSGFPLKLSWVEWGGIENEVEYNFDPSDPEHLVRTQWVEKPPQPIEDAVPNETVVGRYVSGTATMVYKPGSPTDPHMGNTVFELTVELSEGARREATEIRTFEIHPRVIEPVKPF